MLMIGLPPVTERDVYISRSFAAPRATVWKFWTEPARLAEWFGPNRTRMTLQLGPFMPEVRDLTADGWNPSFDRLTTIFEGAPA